MNRQQQEQRRNELIAEIAAKSQELAEVNGLTFQRWAVNPDMVSPIGTKINGMAYDANSGVAYYLRQTGFPDAVEGSQGNKTKAIVEDSAQPPAILKGYQAGPDADGNYYEAEQEIPWTLSDE